MPEPDRKSKMISFRISAMEYEALRLQYRSYGVRNVSELARTALKRIMGEAVASNADLAVKVAKLENRLDTVESELSSTRHRQLPGGKPI